MIKQSFNKDWYFEDGCRDVFVALLNPQSKRRKITLPHDATIEKQRNKDVKNGSGNGYYPEGNYTYTKTFFMKKVDDGKNIYLEFEGVYHNAFVYINKSFAGRCPYGYGNFYINATPFIRFGKVNEIQVLVKNDVPSGRWYTGGGIYRNVNLMIGERLHIVPDGIRLKTVEVEQELAVVSVETEIEYTGTGTRNIVLSIQLLKTDGTVAAESGMPITVMEHSKKVYSQKLYVERPLLWNEDSPYCYRYRAFIAESGKMVDEENGTFGIRKLSLDPKNGLRINGRKIKLRGGCIHHDNGVIGAAEFSHAEEVRIRALKEAGYNAVRSSHHPASRILLDVCDRLGMYVMDEYTDVWTSSKVEFDYSIYITEWWKHDITNMVRKDYNHPSVILYSIGNEIPETGNQYDAEWGKKFADLIRTLDNTRYILNSLNLLHSLVSYPDIGLNEFADEMSLSFLKNRNEDKNVEVNGFMNNLRDATQTIIASDIAGKVIEETAAQVDIVGYNYAACRYEEDSRKYPNRIIVGSETYPKDLDTNWKLVKKLPQVIGDFSWTAYDYLGETGVGRINYTKAPGRDFYAEYPYRAAYCGDINLIGTRRPVSYWREIVWGMRTAPYIAVQPPCYHGKKPYMTRWGMTNAVRSWNWTGYENCPVTVEVYTSADEVALYVNGVFSEKRKVGEEKSCIVKFETVFEPGSVEVIAYHNGREVGRDRINTAEKDVQIWAEADRQTIPADGSDICYVEICMKDRKGILNPEAEYNVHISLDGPGQILGYGSGNPESEENYFDKEAKAYEGQLRAAVRGTGSPGYIIVTLQSEDCEKKQVSIRTI